jgi:hypothetical protein
MTMEHRIPLEKDMTALSFFHGLAPVAIIKTTRPHSHLPRACVVFFAVLGLAKGRRVSYCKIECCGNYGGKKEHIDPAGHEAKRAEDYGSYVL